MPVPAPLHFHITASACTLSRWSPQPRCPNGTPAHALLVLIGGKEAPALLVYVRIALPAIRSAKPGRRKTAAAILRQLRNARQCSRRQLRECRRPFYAVGEVE